MQAIKTQYFGPTNSRGSRIKATCDAGSVTMSYHHELSINGNHRAAAQLLMTKLGWHGEFVSGWLGAVCVHVFKDRI